MAVLLSLVEGVHHDVDRFLHGCRSVGQQVIVTVAAALDSLEVVALRSLNVARGRGRRA